MSLEGEAISRKFAGGIGKRDAKSSWDPLIGEWPYVGILLEPILSQEFAEEACNEPRLSWKLDVKKSAGVGESLNMFSQTKYVELLMRDVPVRTYAFEDACSGVERLTANVDTRVALWNKVRSQENYASARIS